MAELVSHRKNAFDPFGNDDEDICEDNILDKTITSFPSTSYGDVQFDEQPDISLFSSDFISFDNTNLFSNNNGIEYSFKDNISVPGLEFIAPKENNNNSLLQKSDILFPSDMSIGSKSLKSWTSNERELKVSIESTFSKTYENQSTVNISASNITTSKDSVKVVRVALKEEINCLYDSVSQISSCAVKGSIQIKPTPDLEGSDFNLIVKDVNSDVENIRISESAIGHMTQNKRKDDKFSCLFRIPRDIKALESGTNNFQLCQYNCKTHKMLLPMIVKTKVSIINNCCRLILQITSNSLNKSKLSNLTILTAIPPIIDDCNMNISCDKKGYYDKTKRLVVWFLEELESGRVLELHVQCEFRKPETPNDESHAPPIFPVIVRCSSFKDQLSGIELEVYPVKRNRRTNPNRVEVKLSKSYRVIYRNV